MRKKDKRKSRTKTIGFLAERAMREAVAEVIAEHRRTGEPLALWKNGRAVMVPPSRLGPLV
ncbi:MAG: hypothetical protein HZB91_01375 [Elusimicrobia bacterium]|nr:hypothetical protein [Elusimicrobiota bacterium]